MVCHDRVWSMCLRCVVTELWSKCLSRVVTEMRVVAQVCCTRVVANACHGTGISYSGCVVPGCVVPGCVVLGVCHARCLWVISEVSDGGRVRGVRRWSCPRCPMVVVSEVSDGGCVRGVWCRSRHTYRVSVNLDTR